MKKLICMILSVLMLLSLTACGGQQETSSNAPRQLDLAETYNTIMADKDLPNMYAVNAQQMLDLYGIREEYCSQALVYLCINSLRADEIWLLEAKDEASLETLKNLAQARLDQKDAESVTYSPEQNAVVKKAQIIVAGNYLVMICSPEVDAIAADFRTAAGI